jgi:hypothetical protein
LKGRTLADEAALAELQKFRDRVEPRWLFGFVTYYDDWEIIETPEHYRTRKVAEFRKWYSELSSSERECYRQAMTYALNNQSTEFCRWISTVDSGVVAKLFYPSLAEVSGELEIDTWGISTYDPHFRGSDSGITSCRLRAFDLYKIGADHEPLKWFPDEKIYRERPIFFPPYEIVTPNRAAYNKWFEGVKYGAKPYFQNRPHYMVSYTKGKEYYYSASDYRKPVPVNFKDIGAENRFPSNLTPRFRWDIRTTPEIRELNARLQAILATKGKW